MEWLSSKNGKYVECGLISKRHNLFHHFTQELNYFLLAYLRFETTNAQFLISWKLIFKIITNYIQLVSWCSSPFLLLISLSTEISTTGIWIRSKISKRLQELKTLCSETKVSLRNLFFFHVKIKWNDYMWVCFRVWNKQPSPTEHKQQRHL